MSERQELRCAECGSEEIYVPGYCYIRCQVEDDEGMVTNPHDVIKAEVDVNEWKYWCAACDKEVEVRHDGSAP